LSNQSERENTNYRPVPPVDNIKKDTLKHYVTLLEFGKNDPDLMMWINEAWTKVNFDE